MIVATPAVQPDNRPTSAFSDQRAFIVAVFHELNRRLAPAQLADSAANGAHLTAWLRQNVQGTPQSVSEFADLLEQAVKATVFDRKLVWVVEPKALRGPNKPEKPVSAAESEAKFAKWRKDAEAKQKYHAEQSAAEKRIVGLINAFSPARQNRLDYAAQEKFQKHWRGQLEDAKRNGKDLRDVEDAIRNVLGFEKRQRS